MKLASIPEFINSDIDRLKSENLYRKLRNIDYQNGSFLVSNKEIINFNSNDYLGLSTNQIIIRNTVKGFDEISQCSSRLVGGNNSVIEKLENSLSGHRNTESS